MCTLVSLHSFFLTHSTPSYGSRNGVTVCTAKVVCSTRVRYPATTRGTSGVQGVQASRLSRPGPPCLPAFFFRTPSTCCRLRALPSPCAEWVLPNPQCRAESAMHVEPRHGWCVEYARALCIAGKLHPQSSVQMLAHRIHNTDKASGLGWN